MLTNMTSDSDPVASLNVYRDQIQGSLDTYEASLRSWRLRRKIYQDLLTSWSEYGQLRSNPVDLMRFECE